MISWIWLSGSCLVDIRNNLMKVAWALGVLWSAFFTVLSLHCSITQNDIHPSEKNIARLINGKNKHLAQAPSVWSIECFYFLFYFFIAIWVIWSSLCISAANHLQSSKSESWWVHFYFTLFFQLIVPTQFLLRCVNVSVCLCYCVCVVLVLRQIRKGVGIKNEEEVWTPQDQGRAAQCPGQFTSSVFSQTRGGFCRERHSALR